MPVGVGAEPARFSFYARNRFELACKMPPKWNFPRFCRPNGRLFLWPRAARARCFLGGNEEIAAPISADFVL